MAVRLNPFTGELDLVGSTGGGGGGTVTSVAGGVGITATPEPITGAGIVDLDINSLTTETSLAAGDLFAFVDVSVGVLPSAQRKVTLANIVAAVNPLLDHGTLLGLTDDDHLQYLLRAGRAGTANDSIISTTQAGSFYGSSASGFGMILSPNTDTTLNADQSIMVAGNVTTIPPIVFGPATLFPTIFEFTQDLTIDSTTGPAALCMFDIGTFAQPTPEWNIVGTNGMLAFSFIALDITLKNEIDVTTSPMLGVSAIFTSDLVIVARGPNCTAGDVGDGLTTYVSGWQFRVEEGAAPSLDVLRVGAGIHKVNAVETAGPITIEQNIGWAHFGVDGEGTTPTVVDDIAFFIPGGTSFDIVATNIYGSLVSEQALRRLYHAGPIRTGDATTAGVLELSDGSSNFTNFTTKAQAADLTYTLPAAIVAGGALTTAAGGDLTWVVYQPLDADLTAIATLAGTGLLAHTGAGTWAERTLTAPAAGITISNPGGVAGNPTFALANDLAALEGLGSTGFAVRSAADTWVQRSITAGTAIVVNNGDGVGANPDISIDWSGLTADTTIVSTDSFIFANGVGIPANLRRTTFANIATSLNTLGTLDHGNLAGLADDDHAQYALLAGRSGGQTLKGGTAAGDDLTLQSTNSATRGTIFALDVLDLRTGVTLVGDTTGASISSSFTFDATDPNLLGILINGTWTRTANGLANTSQLMRFESALTNSGVVGMPLVNGFAWWPTWTMTQANSVLNNPIVISDRPTVNTSGGGSGNGGSVNNNYTTVDSNPTFNANINIRRGWRHQAHLGTGTLAQDIALDVGALTGTTSAAVQSAITAASTRFFLKDDGGAQSKLTGKFTTYNAIPTEGFGVPAITDSVAITGRTTNIAATNFDNANVAGIYRIQWYIVVTTTAAVPTITVSIAYTDDAAARTVTSAAVAFAATNFLTGSHVVRLNSGNITYATTLTGAIGTGVYAFYATCERLV